MRSRSYTLAVAVVAGVAVHALGAAQALAVAPTVAPASVVVAKYTFDGGSGAILDISGKGHTMTLVASHGGAIRPVLHGAGEALAFPGKCSGKKPPCPHAVLQSPNSADLNPGLRPVAYGATVRLARSQTSKGQNVVQKGYSATSSQYKLQVDGIAGRPSCVLVDEKTLAIMLVRSAVTVADGTWHTVECSRAGEVFIILVDGLVRGSLRVPVALSVSNTSPLSIGGKGTSRDNDQFQGAVDDVWVRTG
jgi:Concanavalin A-like lectin/glucanases superfamily